MSIEIKLGALGFGLLLCFYIRIRRLKKLIKETMKDNDLLNENTSIGLRGKRKYKIYNYKKKEDDKIRKFIKVLSQELETNFIFKRKFQIIHVKELPKIKRKGIFIQNPWDGEYKKLLIKNNMFENGFCIIGKVGAGKSVLANKFIEKVPEKDIVIISPKVDEDFKNGIGVNKDSERIVLEMIKKADLGQFRDGPTKWIVLDELIRISSVFSKETIKKINDSLSICRSQNLKWIFLSQKLQKSSVGVDIGLVDSKMINIADVSNFTASLGQEVKTNTNVLKKGEFLFLHSGEEKLIINKI